MQEVHSHHYFDRLLLSLSSMFFQAAVTGGSDLLLMRQCNAPPEVKACCKQTHACGVVAISGHRSMLHTARDTSA